jgi:cardiolipin synthase
MKRVGLLLILLGACAEAPAPDPAVVDVCEAAARHIAACTGRYLTPPLCDDAAAAWAETYLGQACDELPSAQPTARADGPTCDWFGTGCAPDEDIFRGAACGRDADCGAGWCAEGHCFAGVASDEMDGILGELTGSDVVGGSRARLLVDNAATAQLWRELIDGATHSVHVMSLIIENNPIGHDIAARLAAAARRGVEVRVIVDSVSELTYGKVQILTDLASAGALVIAFNPVADWAALRWQVDLWLNQRIHEKVLVVDGRRAIVGGRNIGDSYLGAGRRRDTDVVVDGPAVAELQRLFLGNWDQFAAWEKLAGCPQARSSRLTCPDDAETHRSDDLAYVPALDVAGGDDLRVVHSNPRVQTPADGYQTYLALIRGARRSIRINNAYFVPPQRLRRHLAAAAARGVEVTVITNSKESVDEDVMWYAAANFTEELVGAGVDVLEWTGTETNHAKTMIVDDEIAVIASYNLDPRSATTNSESLAVIRGATVAELGAAWAIDRGRCTPARTDFTFFERLLIRAHRIAEPLL